MKKVDHTYLAQVLQEIREQPPWRLQADREMDYYDSNQLDSEILQAMQEKGIPPSIENLIAGAINDIVGMEEKNRTDFRVEPDGDIGDEESKDVAAAIHYKMNKAERASGADASCGSGYNGLVSVGLGWVEVSRETDPFKFPYRCKYVHRNEIWWDFLGKEPDLSDARWMLRRRWTDKDVVKMMFPKKKELIEQVGSTNWVGVDDATLTIDYTGSSTDLAQSMDIERGWSVEEQEWRIPETGRVCLFELHTREWEEVFILRMEGGRVVELDNENPNHMLAIALGRPVEKAKISRVYKHIFIGPHLLQSEKTEFGGRFQYVPFWGFREDRTGIPYGKIRGLMYLQDEVNARVSKQQWLLSSKTTVRTDGAVIMDDDTFHAEAGRPDADIKLDQAHMAMPGAKFEIIQNEALNQQQYNRLVDLRESIKGIAGVSAAMSGDARPENSGALSQMIEQSTMGLAKLNSNYAYSRMVVGDLLMTMIINDMGDKEDKVSIEGNTLKETRVIPLNVPAIHPETGHKFLTNDVQRTKLKCALSEVPSTSSYRKQELATMGEFSKALPEEYRAVMAPFMMDLTSVSNKEEIIKAILEVRDGKMLSADKVAEAVKAAVEEAKTSWMVEQKNRELDMKERKTDAEIEKIGVENVLNRIESSYSAIMAAVQALTNAQVAPIADQIMKSAGAIDQDTPPIIAAPQMVNQPAPVEQAVEPPQENTSPMFPPRVQEPDIVQQAEPAIEAINPGPDAGINEGIEAGV